MSHHWFTKYKPEKFTELSLSDDSGFKLLEWLRTPQNGSVLNLFGPVGIGKSCLLYAVAKALNYAILEYETIQNEDLKKIGSTRTLGGRKFLIHVDESEGVFSTVPWKFTGLTVPIIFTTSSTMIKGAIQLKMNRPNNEQILNMIKQILKSEGRQLDDKLILRLCEICNGDCRAVINYCQLFSGSSNIKNLQIINKIAVSGIFSSCKAVLNRRMSLFELEQLEQLYSDKLVNFCLSSLLENNKEVGLLRAIESLSELSMLPEKYKYLSIDPINKLRSEFIYKKEETPAIGRCHGHESLLWYLPLYRRDLQNKSSTKHLQAIFYKFNVQNLEGIDQEIKDYVELTAIETRVFKYKYNLGSSSAVRMDITLYDIHNM